MSTKIATITLALLSLTLSLTLSSAQTGCPTGFNSIPEILKHYELPPGFFPDYVKDFSCYPVSGKDALGLSIQLEGVCTVIRELYGVNNVLKCQPKISAIVSRRQLTHVTGVTIKLSFLSIPLGDMIVTRAIVFDDGGEKKIQFFADNSFFYKSPAFSISDFPSEPPKCDLRPRSIFGYSASAANTNQDIPNYGVLLPFVA